MKPLDFLGHRVLKYIPIHFVTYDIDCRDEEISSIQSWITTNLNGRYAICKMPVAGKGIEVPYRIGFEDPKELTFFIISYSRSKQ